MDSRLISYDHFYSLCNRWREKFPSENSEFKDFLCLLNLEQDEFACEIHDPNFLGEMRTTLLIRIADLNSKHDWMSLIELWDEFKLGIKIEHWCALAVEAHLADGRPSVAARIVATHPINENLTVLALTEYARDCEDRGQATEFQTFCRSSGILPAGPTPMF